MEYASHDICRYIIINLYLAEILITLVCVCIFTIIYLPAVEGVEYAFYDVLEDSISSIYAIYFVYYILLLSYTYNATYYILLYSIVSYDPIESWLVQD